MSKKIIFTVTNDLTYDQRMQKICRSMVAAGYRVELVGRELSKSKPLTAEPYKQTRLNCFFNKGKLFYIEYNIRLFIYLLFTKFDSACAIDLDTIVPVYHAGKLKGAKLAYDAHEYFTEVPEVIRRPKVQRVWQWVERNYVPKFDLIYTVSPTLAKMFAEHYGKDVGVVMNVPRYDAGQMTEDGGKAPLTLIVPKEFSIAKWFLGFSSILFLIGIAVEIFIGNTALDIQMHDAYFVISHTLIFTSLAVLVLIISAIYWLFKLIVGVPANEKLSRIHFWLVVLAMLYGIVFPYLVTLYPQPRYYTFTTFDSLNAYNRHIFFLAMLQFILVFGSIILLPVNLVYSFFTKNQSAATGINATPSSVTRHPLSVPYLLYQGALNEGRGLEHLIEAMQHIDSKLLLAGEGDLSNDLRALVKQLNLENKVEFLGYVKPADLREITAKAYIGINLLENKGLSYYYSLSNKFFDYIHASVPQVCIGFPEYVVLNEIYNVALLTQNCNVQEIKEAILRLLTDRDLYATLQKNCEVCSRELTWQAEEKKLSAFYEQLFR